jgi:hypothetical protein
MVYSASSAVNSEGQLPSDGPRPAPRPVPFVLGDGVAQPVYVTVSTVISTRPCLLWGYDFDHGGGIIVVRLYDGVNTSARQRYSIRSDGTFSLNRALARPVLFQNALYFEAGVNNPIGTVEIEPLTDDQVRSLLANPP